MNQTPLAAVQNACSDLGISAPESLDFDGRVHRYHCPIHDKKGERNAWYKAVDNGDGTFGGTVGHWKLGIKQNWFTGSAKRLTPEERAAYARQQAERRQRQEEELKAQYQRSAERSRRFWKLLEPASSTNEYLVRQGVLPHGAKQWNDTLVLDYRDPSGRITTLQFIQPDGTKRFLTGGKAGGSYHRIGLTRPDDALTLAEGFATGASIHEATGLPCAVCGSAGNIAPVALAIRQKFPNLTIVICADRDAHGRGEAAAREAAELVDGTVVLPNFEGADDGR